MESEFFILVFRRESSSLPFSIPTHITLGYSGFGKAPVFSKDTENVSNPETLPLIAS